jgi:hypothetical protein
VDAPHKSDEAVNGDTSATLVKINPDTGQSEATWEAYGEDPLVACNQLWTFGFSESGAFMTQVDIRTGKIASVAIPMDLAGLPTLIGTGSPCWLVSQHGVQVLMPDELASSTAIPAGYTAAVVGDSLWLTTPGGMVSRFDPQTGAIGDGWMLPPEDLLLDAKGGPDWLLVSAGRSLWLLNRNEAVRYQVPAE